MKLNAATEFILAMLLAQNVDEEMAKEAAELMHAKCDELTLSSEKSLTMLIDAFMVVYRDNPSRALQILEEKLI